MWQGGQAKSTTKERNVKEGAFWEDRYHATVIISLPIIATLYAEDVFLISKIDNVVIGLCLKICSTVIVYSLGLKIAGESDMLRFFKLGTWGISVPKFSIRR